MTSSYEKGLEEQNEQLKSRLENYETLLDHVIDRYNKGSYDSESPVYMVTGVVVESDDDDGDHSPTALEICFSMEEGREKVQELAEDSDYREYDYFQVERLELFHELIPLKPMWVSYDRELKVMASHSSDE